MLCQSHILNSFASDSAQKHAAIQLTQCDWLLDETFVSILRSSWQSQYADYIGSEAADSLMTQLHNTGDIYDHNEKDTWIATLNGQNVGIVSVRDLDKMLLITLLEVLPEHQRKGLATQMLNTICRIDKPILVHVSVHRPWLKKLYERQGFKCLAPEVIEHYGHSLTFDVMAKA